MHIDVCVVGYEHRNELNNNSSTIDRHHSDRLMSLLGLCVESNGRCKHLPDGNDEPLGRYNNSSTTEKITNFITETSQWVIAHCLLDNVIRFFLDVRKIIKKQWRAFLLRRRQCWNKLNYSSRNINKSVGVCVFIRPRSNLSD